MNGFAFGQYYPADSLLHRLDPRAKLIMALLYVITSFLCKNVLGFAAMLALAFLLILWMPFCRIGD